MYQEVHARWLMLTLTAISNQLVQGRVEQQMSHRQQDYKVNVLVSMANNFDPRTTSSNDVSY